MTCWAYKFFVFLYSYVAQSFVIICPFLERPFSYTCRTFSSLNSSLKCFILSGIFPDVPVKNLCPLTLALLIHLSCFSFIFPQSTSLTFYIFWLLLSIDCLLLPQECKLHHKKKFCLCYSLIFTECLLHVQYILGT